MDFCNEQLKKLYAAEKKRVIYHHSSFLAGGATLAAGRLGVTNEILKINNVLIQLYAKRGDAVLDLPCGKIRKVKEDDESNVEGQSYESHSVYELSTVSHSPLQVDDPKEEEKELSSELIRSPQAQDTSSYKRTLSGWSSQPNSRGANDCNIAKDQLKKFCKFLSAASST
nr:IQ domain-containing protein IQM3-like isoform X3 [Nicotiana tomentosiformis]